VPITFYSAVSATVARRPYIYESEGALILQSDASLNGVVLDVAVLLTSQHKTWHFPGILGGTLSAQLLPLPFKGLPLSLNNDLVITVTVLPANATSFALTIYSRLIRAAPPPPTSSTVPVQVDREHVGSLRVGGTPWNGVGFYIQLNTPDTQELEPRFESDSDGRDGGKVEHGGK
jgi:hypothetical protein